MKRFVLLGVDLSLIAMATVLAQLLRDNFELSAQHFGALLPYLFFSLTCAAVILTVTGTSGAMWRFTTTTDYLKIALACALTVLASVGVAFSYSRLDGVARAVPILQLMLMSILMISARLLIRSRNRRRFKPAQLKSVSSTRPLTSVLVVGATTLTELYLRAITECAADRIQVVGVVARKESKVGRTLLGHKVLGSSDAILPLINELNVHGIRVDRVAVMTAHAKLTAPEQQALAEVEGKTDIIVQYLDEIALGAAAPTVRDARLHDSDPNEPNVAFLLSNDRLDQLARRPFWRIKRVFDLVLAVGLLVCLAPVVIVVALLVAIDIGFPVIFWQQRPGVGGNPFRIYKFRTMAAAHSADGRRASDTERSTRIGRFLRRTRLDELPQLFNILTGQMSFVGPRPLLPVDQPAAYSARKFVRPGLTGWAQVNGGRSVSAADKAALDVWYIENASFTLDLKIFARTFAVVLVGERANAMVIGRAWSDLSVLGVCQRQAGGAGASFSMPVPKFADNTVARRVA